MNLSLRVRTATVLLGVSFLLLGTETFRFLSYFASVSPAVVLTILGMIMALTSVWLAWVSRQRLHRNRGVFAIGWVLVFMWPVVSWAILACCEPRRVERYIMAGIAFVGGFEFYRATGKRAIGRLSLICLVALVVSVGVSIIRPDLFRVLALEAEARISAFGRGFGLYLQPNRAASFGVVFAVVASAWGTNKYIWRICVLATAWIGILGTGSRSHIVIAALIFLVLAGVYAKDIKVGRRKLSTAASVGVGFGCLALFIGASYLSLVVSPRIASTMGAGDRLREQLEYVTNVQGTRSLAADASLDERLEYQGQYMALIGEAPIVGHGSGAVEEFQERRFVTGSSHNVFLRFGVEFGVIYVGLVVGMLVATMVYGWRGIGGGKPGWGSIGVVGALFMSGMVVNTLWEHWAVLFLLGAVVAEVQPAFWVSDRVSKRMVRLKPCEWSLGSWCRGRGLSRNMVERRES